MANDHPAYQAGHSNVRDIIDCKLDELVQIVKPLKQVFIKIKRA